ncbi:coproporphyrinogen III oxidase [Geotalea uraniireducens]|uniref:Heme chaperone HemW n=1 Tax=Geotalea uraniireducens TaxID=351604 RepID=A0ABN6VQV3_9BACT|nr:radical SAM family heme chaperone HemW [Geotalea uraniireducens]BDV41111.1 coproporphyrinogen III oxidase [Geotalea uraniireducens]
MPLSLYIHVPFCVRKCGYCSFVSTATPLLEFEEYVSLLVTELELRSAALLRDFRVATIYFGGGTPSLLAPPLINRFLTAVFRLLAVADDAEVTLEANPGTVTAESLAAYRTAGVNRLSLGVQSLDDRMLEKLGRIHTCRDARNAVDAARAAGFANLGIDLIHSLPGQDCRHWRSELLRALQLAPDHVSAYGLTVEEGTPFARLVEAGTLVLPEEEESARMFEMTMELLTGAGYDHYEISNFARPGYRSRHNQVYWQRGDYLGLGVGAHSFFRSPAPGCRWQNHESLADYRQALGAGRFAEEGLVRLTEREAMAEWLFLGLRMREGILIERFREEFGTPLGAVYGTVIDRLAECGLLSLEHGKMRLTDHGLLLSNRVFAAFL